MRPRVLDSALELCVNTWDLFPQSRSVLTSNEMELDALPQKSLVVSSRIHNTRDRLKHEKYWFGSEGMFLYFILPVQKINGHGFKDEKIVLGEL